MAELDGKVAIVTGSAQGIGEASVRALAAAGAKVVVADLNVEGAENVAESLVRAGSEAIAVAVDVSEEEDVTRLAATTIERYGGIDILHNNAALLSLEVILADGIVHEMDVALWDRVMAVNVRGYMLCAKHAIPSMLERGGGVIINSVAGREGQGLLNQSAYLTSKSALIGFTQTVATQYGKQGIRCLGVLPSVIRTPPLAELLPETAVQLLTEHHLLDRVGVPEDIANVVVFLASDRASFMTGSIIPVDGGFMAHTPPYADQLRGTIAHDD
jgi:NAD(P)-dependent dehydrogenase (short-subunit alcohol dehydrogenase family)